MKKIKLKKRRKGINLIIILITSIVITLYIIFNYIGNALTPIIINYAEKQAKKLSILVISSAVDDELSTNFKQDFFVKNGSEIDYNVYEINNILKNIGINVKEYLTKLEAGEIDNIGISDNDGLNVDKEKLKNGIIYQVPTGIIFNNGVLANLGPKIPVKLHIVGNVTTDLVIDVEEYGLNNAVIKLGVKVVVDEQIILPFSNEQITVETTIPISIKLINGEVPSYYNPYTLSQD